MANPDKKRKLIATITKHAISILEGILTGLAAAWIWSQIQQFMSG